ncbi:MAG: sigma-54-dependent Fis family transcriptional regulator [Nitrospirae bacterium]|nr:sigma-54-dependent Fis family transcriptional regulator [Nitrospirota bacterium]
MSKPRILVVDDEPIVRISCRRALEPEGYEVAQAENANAGLELLAADRFDLVLTDLKMPGMDGIEFLRNIKSRWPETQVVIITGYQTIDTAVLSIKLGAYDYVNKPFTPHQLSDVVRRALNKDSVA